MTQVDLKEGNLRNLEKIQEILSIEERDGSEVTLDEALAKVLSFYRRYVPYN